jgi:UDP-2,4-diacetamido-2,4,6-trideoxy-beta-L-altropyranose hydrolase
MDEARNKRLVLRADADAQIGGGHLLRMLALGQAWIDRGGEASLLTRRESAPLLERFGKEGIETVTLPALSLADEAAAVRDWAGSRNVHFVALDGYQFNTDYQELLAAHPFGVLVVDDFLHHARYVADLILNPNIGIAPKDYQDRFENGLFSSAAVLTGLKYCLLRREFRMLAGTKHEPEGAGQLKLRIPNRVLVTLGGADPDNVSAVILEGLEQLAAEQAPSLFPLQIRLIVGSHNFHHQKLQAAAERIPHTEVVVSVENMMEHYQWADLAIVAGGSTNWELCLFAVPRLVVVLAENQIAIAQRIEEVGLGLNLGWGGKLLPSKIAQSVSRLISDMDLREAQAKRCGDLVDGKGADRVVDSILDSLRRRAPQHE